MAAVPDSEYYSNCLHRLRKASIDENAPLIRVRGYGRPRRAGRRQKMAISVAVGGGAS